MEEVVLDCEFADDTTLYVVGDDRNLCNVQSVILQEQLSIGINQWDFGLGKVLLLLGVQTVDSVGYQRAVP